MSLLFPDTPAEVAKGNWGLALFLIAPLVVIMALWWRLYFSFAGLLLAFQLAVVVAIPLATVGWIRARKLVALGLHLYFPRGRKVQWRVLFVIYLGAVTILYAWFLVVFAIELLAHPNQKSTHLVLSSKPCTRACMGCSHTIKLAAWPGESFSSMCATSGRESLQIGERLIFEGRASPRAIYVAELARGG